MLLRTMHIIRRAVEPTRIALALLAVAAAASWSRAALAEEQDQRLEFGIVARFMPTGWFDWSSHTPLRAYPALGGALFIDWRLHRFISIGFMPELTLNVIPKLATGYPVSAMTTGSIRLKAQYPDWQVVIPYLLLAPGYSVLSRYGGDQTGDAHGFSLGAYGGVRVPVSRRNSILAEGGYLRGFQADGGRAYAPSYLVLALGWQLLP
jgi:hypothetical protein